MIVVLNEILFPTWNGKRMYGMSGIIKGTVLLRIVTWFGYVCPALVRIGEIRNKELWR
jgi:hypothetical protein